MIEDLIIAARTVWGEARGETYEGKKAVAHVLMNRLRAGHGRASTLSGVCLAPLQFSCWNGSDPNLPRMRVVDLDNGSFRQCLKAVIEAMDEPDFTHGARWYHTRGVAPSWSKNAEPCFETGGHLFFNNID